MFYKDRGGFSRDAVNTSEEKHFANRPANPVMRIQIRNKRNRRT